MFTPVMFLDENLSTLSAPSLLRVMPKVPSSPSWILLPLSSCSTRHSHMSERTPFTVPREKTPLWSAMCLANFSSVQISDIWFLACALGVSSFMKGEEYM